MTKHKHDYTGGRTVTKALFFLPVTDGDGRNLEGDIADLLAEVYNDFGGYTDLGLVGGTYRMADGSKAYDKCRAICVAIGDHHRQSQVLIGHILRFKERTIQETIYLEVQRDADVRFI
ncbi:MAG: hypothetical protein ACREKR_12105 [Candidatus Methylomirabilales bacterium]